QTLPTQMEKERNNIWKNFHKIEIIFQDMSSCLSVSHVNSSFQSSLQLLTLSLTLHFNSSLQLFTSTSHFSSSL
ncbi:hypothetical protein BgiBS90_011130, partial [Biomphalaria glabrata]